MPSKDLSRSRAVLIGTWDYEHLPSVPAAHNSLERMRALLTGELCGWPADRVTVIGNRATPGDLHDTLIELYSDTDQDGVALFYFVGHGQPDEQDRLCFGLSSSRTDFNRRASTSLRFDDVRGALTSCAAQTKIVMLDCCFAGLAARPQQSLSGAAVLDMARGAGAYTMAASGAYLPAWFETDTTRPQTYFTKYFVDVVEAGITGQPAGLPLDRIFAEAAANLQRDRKPEPTHTARHEAGRTVFARNAAPAEHQVDVTTEIATLRRQLADAEAAVAALREKDLEVDRRLRAEPERDELLDEANVSAARTAEAQARAADVVEALRARAADPPTVDGTEPVSEMLARLGQTLDPDQLHAMLIDAAERPVAEVTRIVGWLVGHDRRVEVNTVLRWASRRPVTEVAELADALGTPADDATRDLVREFMRLTNKAKQATEVADLLAHLRDTNDMATHRHLVVVVAVQEPDRILAVLDALRANGRENDVQVLLRMTGLRNDAGMVSLYRTLRLRRQEDDLLTMVKARGLDSWWRPGIVREVRRSSIPDDVWQPLMGYSSVQTRYAAYLLLAFLVGLAAGVGGVGGVFRFAVPIVIGALLEWRVSTVFGSRSIVLVLAGLVPVFGLLFGLLLRWAGVAL